ncbi:MAG: 50S ribosomal protein L21e [archaeon]|nr:50S ribosomal protein L21e [archaeon]
MLKHKSQKQKGKISFSRFFQKFKEGDHVAVVRELSIPMAYPSKIQGRTGKVIEKRGSSYYIEIKDINKPKKYTIHPIHLKRIEVAK